MLMCLHSMIECYGMLVKFVDELNIDETCWLFCRKVGEIETDTARVKL